MAKPTLNTDLSRRSMLAAAAAASLPIPAVAAAAENPSINLTVPATVPVSCPADAALLHRMAAVEAAWIARDRAGKHCEAFFAVIPENSAGCRAAVQAVKQSPAYRTAAARFRALGDEVDAALAAALAPPAQSLQGIHARLHFTLRMMRDSEACEYAPADWLEAVLADLARLSGDPRPSPFCDLPPGVLGV